MVPQVKHVHASKVLCTYDEHTTFEGELRAVYYGVSTNTADLTVLCGSHTCECLLRALLAFKKPDRLIPGDARSWTGRRRAARTCPAPRLWLSLLPTLHSTHTHSTLLAHLLDEGDKGDKDDDDDARASRGD